MNSHPLLDKTLALLQKLVEIDTCSRNSNLDLIRFVSDYLHSHGIDAKLIYDEDKRKANLYATIGPLDRRGLCLSGHTDVVPPDGQPWTVEPFALTIRNEKALGRGTADMKGFLAAVLATVPYFLANVKDIPIHLAFSYDEEIGCQGVPSLLEMLRHSSVKPMACIIGEPTSMRVAVAHKGKRAYRCCVKGLAGHSALTHLGVNAVDFAAELTVFLRRIGRQLHSSGLQDDKFAPPYSTVHTGKFKGGVALNVIPDAAELEFEIRNLPGDDVDNIVDKINQYAEDQLIPEMRRVAPNATIQFEQLISYPSLTDLSFESQDARWLQDLARQVLEESTTDTLSFGTEGGLFQNAGIPTIVCGPGNIADAHKADEYVTLNQLSKCLGFLEGLIEQLTLQPSNPSLATI